MNVGLDRPSRSAMIVVTRLAASRASMAEAAWNADIETGLPSSPLRESTAKRTGSVRLG
jgi:hypothetical protein